MNCPHCGNSVEQQASVNLFSPALANNGCVPINLQIQVNAPAGHACPAPYTDNLLDAANGCNSFMPVTFISFGPERA